MRALKRYLIFWFGATGNIRCLLEALKVSSGLIRNKRESAAASGHFKLLTEYVKHVFHE